MEIICSPVIQDRALYEVLKSNVSNDQKKRTLQKLGDEIILKAIGYGLNTDRWDYRKDLLAYLIAKNILEINENKKKCPNCLKNNISRIFYPTNIKFTGEAGHSGFYALDYKLKQKKIDERKKSL